MPDVLSFNPSRALDAAADGSPGAKAYFYDSGTTTLRTVYSDAACTVPHASPLVADATGSFAAVFSNASAIKVVVTDSADATLYTLDPCVRVPTTGAAAASISFTPTVALPYDNVQAAIEGSVAAAASGFNAFGLGVTGSVALVANLDATNLASGQYRFDGTTTGTYPSGVLAADTGAIVVVRETSSSAWMTLFHDTTNAVFIRRMNASAWGAWRETGLGFTPVEQGGGSGMSSDKVRLGWRSDALGLQIQVNSTPLGIVVRNPSTPAGFNQEMRSDGSPPLYACRAWVNFNGTGAVAIRGSGNVSSITDNAVGDYYVNFTTAMPDTNYACVGSQKVADSTATSQQGAPVLPYEFATNRVRIYCLDNGSGTLRDSAIISVAIFR